MDKKVTAITVIVAILATAILVGCVEKGTPISNSDFKNISADACDNIGYQLGAIWDATDKGDVVIAKTELAAFDTSVKQYIEEFEEMEVAENTIPCKKALIATFEESQILGVYLNAFLENPTVVEYVRCTVQAINVTNQLEITAMLAKSI
jgi:hypothetical protein